MKKLAAFLTALILIFSQNAGSLALEKLSGEDIPIPAPYAVLIERTTGQVIYEKEAHVRCAPASVTKVMTMLLVAEALDDGRINAGQMVTASETACSMGGSQIWLEPGERMTVSEMLKCVAVVSANDCAVALAELLCGSEDAFVKKMNERASELGMNDTHFKNCTGLFDDDDHYTSAYDIALMSRELLAHDCIREYTTIWMDSIRDGEFGLSNTNKLIYYYEGATGLKTGFTSKAMYCLSASAMRDGVEYIAVVLHAANSAERFDSAKTLLNYAFANCELALIYPDEPLPPVLVELGSTGSIQPVYEGGGTLLEEKGKLNSLRYEIDLLPSVPAPVYDGQKLGKLVVRSGDELLAEVNIISPEEVERMTCWDIYARVLGSLIGYEWK